MTLTGAAADPSDLVPQGSGLYDALALLAQRHLLPPGAPDTTDLLGVTGRLYSRAEFAALVRGVVSEPSDPRSAAALAFARNALAPELGRDFDSPGSSIGAAGFVQLEAGGRTDTGGNLRRHGETFARGRLFGTLGRDGAYTLSLTNIYRETRDHASFTTKNNGLGGGGNPDALSGVDEVFITTLGRHDFRATFGELRQRWGSGYRGDMMVSDTSPARPTIQIEFPFSLGHGLGGYRYTQFEEVYSNAGHTVYQGARRIEHPIGDRVSVSLEENYLGKDFNRPEVLVLPFYLFQKIAYTNRTEPQRFNYNFNAGLVIRPDGPSGQSRLYGQFYVDDLQAPKGLGQGNITPRKIGYLLGYAQNFPRTGTSAVLEYARTDRETYTKLAPLPPELASFDNTLPLGHPIGPNGKEGFIRLDQRLASHWQLAAEGRVRRRTSSDFPGPDERALDIALAYRLGASRSLGLRYGEYHENAYSATAIPTSPGGAAYGENIRRRTLGISFLQAF